MCLLIKLIKFAQCIIYELIKLFTWVCDILWLSTTQLLNECIFKCIKYSSEGSFDTYRTKFIILPNTFRTIQFFITREVHQFSHRFWCKQVCIKQKIITATCRSMNLFKPALR